MTGGSFRFDRFRLDLGDRQLRRDGAPLEINSRYFDALALLVREAGALVSKDRFMDEVWRGVPVTDEALTQCVRTLRRLLGDDAGNPRFIQTVPKHGYRFVAAVTEAEAEPAAQPAPVTAEPAAKPRTRAPLSPIWLGGTAGGGVAGVAGGLFYGLAAASGRPGADSGAASVLLVLLLITTALALIGAAAVAFGLAAGARGPGGWRLVAGGALGGVAVGAVVKLLGLDAFLLLLGRSPGDITGAPEGLALGAGVGLAAWAAARTSASPRKGAAWGALMGGAAGLLIALAGGRLLGGSLHLLAAAFPQSRLRLDGVGPLVGEAGFGPVSHAVTATLEGALFAACVVGGILVARRAQPGSSDQPVGR